ncbi:hypothetical protein LTR53_014554 [Teratosphaeriaceae sp. CCFEE 6253]|nr:hypothetical protein LTR53_014554 [Teratosphaeriaceae sp. CCFEE 6253]
MSDSYFTRNIIRSYSGGSGPPWGRQTSAIPAMWLIIGLNTAVFAGWQYAKETKDQRLTQRMYANFTLSWANVRDGRLWTVITSAFSHTALWHFGFNMLAFRSFASGLSWFPGIGAFHLLALSLGSGLAGSAAWLATKDRQGRQGAREAALGASGIVMGVGSAVSCLMPTAAVNFMFIPVPVPLWAVTAGYLAFDSYFLHSETSRIGHAAHLGGAVWGLAYYVAFLRGYGGVWRFLASRRR